MSDIQQIVQVTISRETQNISRAGFGTPLIVDVFDTPALTNNVTRCASLSEVTAAGFASTTEVYKAAAKLFSQNPAPSVVVIGQIPASYSALGDAMDDILVGDSDFYGIIPVGATINTIAEQTAMAAWVEANKRICILLSEDDDILDSGSTADIAAALQAAAYERTAVIYHAKESIGGTPTTIYANAAWVGNCFPFEPGSQTWAYKTLTGVAADGLLTPDINAALGKGANVYTRISGVNLTRNGTMASGEYIDVIRGMDWVEARLQEEVFTLLVNRRKVPYSDEGIALVEGAVRSVLDQATRKGILQKDSVTVTAPRYSEIPQGDKLSRNLPDIKFTALLEGAIHTTQINGIVTV